MQLPVLVRTTTSVTLTKGADPSAPLVLTVHPLKLASGPSVETRVLEHAVRMRSVM